MSLRKSFVFFQFKQAENNLFDAEFIGAVFIFRHLIAAEIHHLHKQRLDVQASAVGDEYSDIGGKTRISMLFQTLCFHIIVISLNVFFGIG